MNSLHTLSTLALSSLITLSLFGCGPDEKDGEPIDNEVTQKTVRANLEIASSNAKMGIGVMEKSEMVSEFGLTSFSSESCTAEYGNDGSYLGEYCETNSEKINFGNAIDESLVQLQTTLNDYVFTDKNIESSQGNQVTYLIRGANFCPEGPDQGQCISEIDKVQLRLVVTSPRKGDLTIRAQIGSQRYSPFTLDLFSNKIGLETDLGEIKKSLIFLSQTYPSSGINTSDLPSVMEGRVRGEFRWVNDTSISASYGVTQTVKVENGGKLPFKLAIAPAPEAFYASVDAIMNKVTYKIDWKAIDLSFNVDQTRRVPVPGSADPFETTKERIQADVKLHADAIGALGEWTTNTDVIDFALTLGQGPATIDINNNRVAEASINPADGGVFSGQIAVDAFNEAVTVTAKNALDAKIKLAFASVADALKDPKMKKKEVNETYQIVADQSTQVEFSGNLGKVLKGAFTLLAVDSNLKFEATANQCFDNSKSSENGGIEELEIIVCK